jgi:shikimate kinase
MRPLNLYLIGPMGAGKSTIGKYLARELNIEFYDTDHVIEERSGADIGWIFDVEGEDGFRRRERKIIDELTQRVGIVLATGGGAILDIENRNRLAARGTVVYLHTTVEQQMKRTMRDKRRPELQQENFGSEDMIAIMQERDPLYKEIADIIVETDGRTVRSVAAEVIRLLDEELS